jgi:hypothetical protein
MMQSFILMIFAFLAAAITTIHLSNVSDAAYAQSTINPLCVIKGESVPPPPVVVLRWDTSGICDSTIDHFTNFYDIKAIVTNDTGFIVFFESN